MAPSKNHLEKGVAVLKTCHSRRLGLKMYVIGGLVDQAHISEHFLMVMSIGACLNEESFLLLFCHFLRFGIWAGIFQT